MENDLEVEKLEFWIPSDCGKMFAQCQELEMSHFFHWNVNKLFYDSKQTGLACCYYVESGRIYHKVLLKGDSISSDFQRKQIYSFMTFVASLAYYRLSKNNHHNNAVQPADNREFGRNELYGEHEGATSNCL